MVKGYRGAPRGTLLASRRDHFNEGQPDHSQLPRIDIGRFVLDISPHPNYCVSRTLHDYRDDLRSKQDAEAIQGYTVNPDVLFLSMFGADKFRDMSLPDQRRQNQGPTMRKARYAMRQVKSRISEVMEQHRIQDRELALRKHELARGMLLNDDLELVDTILLREELGDYEIWGDTTASLRPQPTLIDEFTIGFKVEVDDVLVKGATQVLSAIRDAGYRGHVENTNPHEMYQTIEMIRTDEPFTTRKGISNLEMPRPPAVIALGPITIVEFC